MAFLHLKLGLQARNSRGLIPTLFWCINSPWKDHPTSLCFSFHPPLERSVIGFHTSEKEFNCSILFKRLRKRGPDWTNFCPAAKGCLRGDIRPTCLLDCRGPRLPRTYRLRVSPSTLTAMGRVQTLGMVQFIESENGSGGHI